MSQEIGRTGFLVNKRISAAVASNTGSRLEIIKIMNKLF
jgi:hypothetical protein